jgi:hypothetical protein
MQFWRTDPTAKVTPFERGELLRTRHFAATTAAALIGLASLLVNSPAHAQSADPLDDIAARFQDAWLQWSQSSSPVLLCIAPVDDNYQFSSVPVAASVPASSQCLAQDGSVFQPSGAPAPTGVPPAAPAFPAPVPDIVIEQAP